MLRETLPFSPLSARYRPTVYYLRPPDYSLLTKLSTIQVYKTPPRFLHFPIPQLHPANTHTPDDLTHIHSHADPSNFSGERRAGRKRQQYLRQIRYREQTDGGEGRSPSSDLFQLQDQLQGQLTDHSKCRSHEGIY